MPNNDPLKPDKPRGRGRAAPVLSRPSFLRFVLLAIVFNMSGLVGCVRPRPNAASGSKGDVPPTATVRAGLAEFSIPVTHTTRWRWARRETADNAQEYQWEVKVTGPTESYRFGFSLFKFPGSAEGVGGLGDLLDAGQASVWKTEGALGGRILNDAWVSVSAAPGRVIVRVTDSATIRLLFQYRPPNATIVTRTPDAGEGSREVAVSYVQ